MPLARPNVLIPPADDLLSRQIQELVKVLEPLLAGATQPDKAWNPLTLRAPWTNWGEMQASSRTMLSGVFTAKGLLSTLGGQSKALAVSQAGGIVYPSASYITLKNATGVPTPVAILTLPVKPPEDVYLPPQAIFGYAQDKTSFYGSALLSCKKATGTISLEQIMGRTDTSIAVGWLQLEFLRMMGS
jgi:hypothetical protein